MSRLIPAALVAMVLASATAATANNRYDRGWRDWSKPCGGYSCNSQEGQRAFWDWQQEQVR